MELSKASSRWLFVLALAVFLLAPSFDTALKYLGPSGVAAFFAVGTVAVFAVDRLVLKRLVSAIPDRTAYIAAGAMLIALAVAAILIYPRANAGIGGGGSDADDALVTAATALLSGSYPYTSTTYLGNLISPMPGAVILAVPFVLLGAIQLQTVAWLGAFYAAVSSFTLKPGSIMLLVATMLAFSPTLLQNVLTGADYAANSIYVLLGMWILLRTSARRGGQVWAVVSAIFLGIGLSSRSTFMLTIPLLVSAMVQNAGWSRTIRYMIVTGLALTAVTLPFWLYDPAGFAPLKVQSDKLLSVRDVLPYADIVIPGVTAALAIALSFGNMRSRPEAFLLRCGIVQIFVLFVTSLLHSVKLGRLDLFLQQSGYGMFSLIFGATAVWIYLYGTDAASTSIARAEA